MCLWKIRCTFGSNWPRPRQTAVFRKFGMSSSVRIRPNENAAQKRMRLTSGWSQIFAKAFLTDGQQMELGCEMSCRVAISPWLWTGQRRLDGFCLAGSLPIHSRRTQWSFGHAVPSPVSEWTHQFRGVRWRLCCPRIVFDNAFLTEKQTYLSQMDPRWVLSSTQSGQGDRRIYIEYATKTSNPNFPPRIGLGGACSEDQAADPQLVWHYAHHRASSAIHTVRRTDSFQKPA